MGRTESQLEAPFSCARSMLYRSWFGSSSLRVERLDVIKSRRSLSADALASNYLSCTCNGYNGDCWSKSSVNGAEIAVDAEYSTSHDFVGSNNPSPNFGGKERSERNSSFGGAWPVRGRMK